MKGKNNQKGFIQTPVLIGIVVAIIVLVSTSAVLYKQGKLNFLTSNTSEAFKATEDIIVFQKEDLESTESQQTEQSPEETAPGIQVNEEPQQKTTTVEEIKEKKLITDNIATISIKEYLEKQGLINVTIEIVDKKNEGGVKTLTLRYDSTAYQGVDEFSLYGGYTIGKRLVVDDMSKIMFVFTNIIDLGWDTDEFMVVFSDITTGTVKGTWYCNRTWIDDYLGEKMSMEELNSVVKGTMMFF